MVTRTYEPSQVKFGLRYEARESLTSDKFSLFVFIFCVVSILVQASLILTSWSKLPPEIPIFYSRAWGQPMLAAPIFLWILPIMLIIIVFINYSMVIFFMRDNYFLNRVLIVFSAIAAFATLYDMTKIISLII